AALLSRRRLRLLYFSRTRGELSHREVSPQRLVLYRDNWYMDAWCHQRNALRSFALDAIQQAAVTDSPALEIPEDQLDRDLGAGYGIFSGPEMRRALIRFSSRMARWVSREQWHAQQSGRFLDDGSYLLELPYSEDRELLMDLLRYGPDAEVLEPPELRQKIRAALRRTLEIYES
ncbi:MAG: WYL domain-containing protein, partial [Bryobacteraceae bacterium]